MELVISELKNNPERFLNDFDEIRKYSKVRTRTKKWKSGWTNFRAICTFFYNTVIDI